QRLPGAALLRLATGQGHRLGNVARRSDRAHAARAGRDARRWRDHHHCVPPVAAGARALRARRHAYQVHRGIDAGARMKPDTHRHAPDFGLIDVTLRDAHQCLWSTRMTTAMMTPILNELDRSGYAYLNILGGAVFDVCVRYLQENP